MNDRGEGHWAEGPADSGSPHGLQGPALKRSLSLPLITLYGLGTTIGAGIYVLVGKVAGQAGLFAPASFLLAALLAGLTAFSFSELSARFPKSAGEAVYVREGLRSEKLALAVGLLVALTGVISAAAIALGAVGYIREFLTLPENAAIGGLIVLLGSLAAWGIAQSVTVAAILTMIEIGGLVLVIVASLAGTPDMVERIPVLVPPLEPAVWSGILAGGVLAFYAFIGFEDMVNVAEEVRDVRRTLPLAIVLTLALTTLLYLVLAAAAVLALPLEELAASEAPLALLYEKSTGRSPLPIGLIAIFATMNGALIQIIMASRIVYGLSSQGSLPPVLCRVNRVTHTPLVATGLVTLAVLVFALWLPIESLARATSMVILAVFVLVNLSLFVIKSRGADVAGQWTVPRAVPLAGFLASAAFLMLEGYRLATT